jgi:hypothetical protein
MTNTIKNVLIFKMADDLSFLSTCCGTDYVHQHENEIIHTSHDNITITI